MENPEPVREHRVLEKLAGHYAGPERMHPSYFNDQERHARAVVDARVALDGFAVVQDYTQELENGRHFAGHGVFRYDMPSDTYELHWFDSTGGPERIFRGGFVDNCLVLTARIGDAWQRVTYDFALTGGYRFKLETSEDGNHWNVAVEGENLETPKREKNLGLTREKARAATAPRRGAKRKKAAAGGRVTAKKATGKKRGAKNKSAAKATVKKAAAKMSAAKQGSAKKAAAKKTTAKNSARKASGKKATAKKAGAGKASAKKVSAKKASAKKASAKKASAKKSAKKKAVRVSALEKKRRQGTASRKTAVQKKKRTTTAATRETVSQKATKGAARKRPRMANLKKTSTRVGPRKTAAKGKDAN